jgi:hypothetical protein
VSTVYKMEIPMVGVSIEDGQRQEWSCTLTKNVHANFAVPVIQSMASIAIQIPMTGDPTEAQDWDTVFVNFDDAYLDADDAPAEDEFNPRVRVELRTEVANMKASPENVARWAAENGWYIEDGYGIEAVEEEEA